MNKKWPPPGFPVIEGDHQLTDDWSVTLPMPMCRRIEDEQLILWRPGFTIWISAWGESEEPQTRAERYAELKDNEREDIRVVRDNDQDPVGLFAYRMTDENDDGEVESLNAFAVAADGHLQMGIYFDDVADEEAALRFVDSIRLVKGSQ